MSENQTTPAPDALVNVTEQGIFVEWHERGMNIELRVRRDGYVWGLVEDARGEVPEFKGSNRAADHVLDALAVMEARHV